jgi:ribonucleoside-triphosphate reductase (thioredoxin)
MDTSQKILSDIVVFNKYAKFIPELSRRETWEELCYRNMDMHVGKFPELRAEIARVYKDFVIPKKVLPSMRSLQFGGRPIELSNARLYNCAYLPLDNITAFNETMFLLLSGTGVGYSIQKHHVEKLPVVCGPNLNNTRRFLIADSIEGWADAIKILVKAYFKGASKPVFDYRDIRPKGTPLKTSGGKAPGPEPLKTCIENIQNILDTIVGNNITPLQAHDIMCYIADAVLSGGIRRSAMIALFSEDDQDMMTCKGQLKIDNWMFNKQGESYQGFVFYKGKRQNTVLSEWDYNALSQTGTLPWYFFEQQRGRANNSVVLHRQHTTKDQFDSIWKSVEESKAGEPGVYWTNDFEWGTNPCCEIALRPFSFCNLSEVNVSNVVDQDDLDNRVRAAAFLGTIQASYTSFHYLRAIWQETTEKDALIGVGMTGIGSGAILKLDLEQAVEVVKQENARVASIIGINTSARCTTVKPSGTASLVSGSSSGIHAWHNDYYIRRMRVGKIEPLYAYVKQNLPSLIEDDFFKPNIEAVISIPQKAPEGSILRTESALDLLERVKWFSDKWIKPGHRNGKNTHNISCTVSLKDHEWQTCGEWMWKNRHSYNGLAVLPYDSGTYIQAPFEDITKEQFESMLPLLNDIDLTQVLEVEDITDHKAEAACAGGACSI